jgi:hypothetical protein
VLLQLLLLLLLLLLVALALARLGAARAPSQLRPRQLDQLRALAPPRRLQPPALEHAGRRLVRVGTRG